MREDEAGDVFEVEVIEEVTHQLLGKKEKLAEHDPLFFVVAVKQEPALVDIVELVGETEEFGEHTDLLPASVIEQRSNGFCGKVRLPESFSSEQFSAIHKLLHELFVQPEDFSGSDEDKVVAGVGLFLHRRHRDILVITSLRGDRRRRDGRRRDDGGNERLVVRHYVGGRVDTLH